jgi:lysophospholipase L1-like esterase
MTLEVFAGAGTGYTTARDPYLGRVPAVVASAPDVVLVQGSTNDKGSREGIQLAATGVFTALREQLPAARIYAVGPAMTPGATLQDVTDARDGVAAAAAQVGVTFLDPLAEAWLPVDGDIDLWGDEFHLNKPGHRQFAQNIVARLAA